MKWTRTKPSWIHLEHGRFLSHWMELEREDKRQGVGGCARVTYLPLGSMTVEAGLGGAVAPALSVVHVELKVDHLSVELYESVRVAFHRTRRGWGGRKGRGVLSLGMG